MNATSTTTTAYEDSDFFWQIFYGSSEFYKPLKAAFVIAGFTGVIGLIHSQLQQFLTKRAAFGVTSYAILVGVFSFNLLSTLYRAVVPLSVIGNHLDMDTAEACFLLNFYGPVGITSMLFIVIFMLSSVLILLTPTTKVALQENKKGETV